MSTGIVGYGVYLPKFRVKREEFAGWGKMGRKGENSVAHIDEDIYTMAAEVALNACQHSKIGDLSDLGLIYLGTASSSSLENSPLGILVDTLDLPPRIDLSNFTSSPNAPFAALKCCLDAIESNRKKYGLVIGSECREVSPGSSIELYAGAGAAGFMLGKEGIIAEIERIATHSDLFYDRWSIPGNPRLKEYEPRFTQKYGYQEHVICAVQSFLAEGAEKISEFNHVAIYQFDERNMRQAVRALKIEEEQLKYSNIFNDVGDLGAASAFLKLCAILDKAKPGDRVLVVSYGGGMADVMSLKVTEVINQKKNNIRSVNDYIRSKEYVSYSEVLKRRKHIRKEEDPQKLGVPPTSPSIWRDGAVIRRLKGARCKNCGYVNFPPTLRKICIRCGNTTFGETTLTRKGKVHTYCFNIYLPEPMVGPQAIVVGDLDDGNRFRALGTEFELGKCEIDMEIELVLRNIIRENGVGIYGYCFRPTRFSS